jgi:lipopolysaccharide transport system permease protein
VIFGKVAGLSTDGMPMSLFYLSGIVVWNFFSENVTRNATIFVDNRPLFSKVYFPRVVTPLAITLSGFMKLTIQLLLFLGFWCYEFYHNPDLIRPNAWILMTPVICIMTAMLSMGIGMIVSGLTAKYRDLKFLMTFGVQLLLYLTPVIYPVSILSGNFKKIIHLNPLSSIIEVFRFGFLGSGDISLPWLGYSAVVCILFFMLGLVIFNRTEKNVMDTV